MNNLQIFNDARFGEIRSLNQGEEILFVVADVCRALDIKNSTQAIGRLDEDERSMLNIGRQGETNVVNEYGLYNLVLASRKPEAKAFKRWITHEVIPSIRKIGGYRVGKDSSDEARLKRLDIMDRNSRTRAANLLLRIAERTQIPEYREVCHAKAAAMVDGREILPIPAAERKTYSAAEIGEMFDLSANKVGKIANANHLKTPEYGKLFYSKSEYSAKEVETWRYYDSVIPALETLLGRKAAVA